MKNQIIKDLIQGTIVELKHFKALFLIGTAVTFVVVNLIWFTNPRPTILEGIGIELSTLLMPIAFLFASFVMASLEYFLKKLGGIK